ncbi:MAG: helix-turn-helix transcriptional regulator [Candidatus Marinimicrobia bacterium]|nr:helix-turn-helix transcriptional regulator [Candidatus Neomarinimicrobiota bacterium]
MTQQELAEAVGVSRQTIVTLEKGQYNPSVALALRMAKFFKVKVEDLFYLEEEI